MTDETPSASTQANGSPQRPEEKAGTQVQVLAQYIKDLSFENPRIERMLEGPLKDVKLEVEVNVNARRVSENGELFEVAIDFNARAKDEETAIYEIETVYGGMFRVANMPRETLEPFLLVHCPSLLFPFLRRIVADTTREGGFEPLLLDPIDFAQLYTRRKKSGDVRTPTQ